MRYTWNSWGNKLGRWNTYLRILFFTLLQKVFYGPLKIDTWYVIFTRQSFATFCNFFFCEIAGNESEWFSNSLRLDHTILQRWEENCWRTFNAVPRACKVNGKKRDWEGGGKGRGEGSKIEEEKRGEKSEKCRLARHRSLERSERQPVCVRRKRHMMKSYERKCCLRYVTSEKFAESSRRDAGCSCRVSWTPTAGGPQVWVLSRIFLRWIFSSIFAVWRAIY